MLATILGYIFGFLGGWLGLAFSIYLVTREHPKAKYHGKIILADSDYDNHLYDNSIHMNTNNETFNFRTAQNAPFECS
jgi:hypothetical protein